MVCNTKTVASELPPVLRVYKDGTVERLLGSPFIPPSSHDSTTTATGVLSKDTTISPLVSARLYLPKTALPPRTHNDDQKLPVLVYFHGGGFCIESAFSQLTHTYMTSLVLQAQVVAVSVEYRLAPEHPLPAAYDDSWAALQWVGSHAVLDHTTVDKDPWLTENVDFDRVYIGGDSAGANIVHNMAIRAGSQTLSGGIKISGAFLSHPYFWGSDAVGSEPSIGHEESLLHKTWTFAWPTAPSGIDNPMINPFAQDAPSMAGLGCFRLLVCTAELDELRERGVRYGEAVRESGWGGDLEVFEVEGEGHCFHIFKPEDDSTKNMIKRLAFLQ